MPFTRFESCNLPHHNYIRTEQCNVSHSFATLSCWDWGDYILSSTIKTYTYTFLHVYGKFLSNVLLRALYRVILHLYEIVYMSLSIDFFFFFDIGTNYFCLLIRSRILINKTMTLCLVVHQESIYLYSL